ncbi:MAG: large subunit ribosomal protein L3 [Planctomycetota bacterium]|jgi:large subunit ribosomal protein L3
MKKFILGHKGRMTQMFNEEGQVVPITLVEVGPCYITKLLTEKSDGYNAVQIGYSETREKVLSKPEVGHCKKAGVAPMRHLREVRLDAASDLELGAEINAGTFEIGDLVDVVGNSKGRGFAGVMKRYNFKGGRMTHGGMAKRRPGSIGAGSAYPGKVFKGKRMSGHYGAERCTTKNLEIVGVDVERGMLMVKGAVPGHRGGLVQISQSISTVSA